MQHQQSQDPCQATTQYYRHKVTVNDRLQKISLTHVPDHTREA